MKLTDLGRDSEWETAFAVHAVEDRIPGRVAAPQRLCPQGGRFRPAWTRWRAYLTPGRTVALLGSSGVGEGLGLYLVQILIERYGGRIWVEDRVPGRSEEGAAFSFLLREARGG